MQKKLFILSFLASLCFSFTAKSAAAQVSLARCHPGQTSTVGCYQADPQTAGVGECRVGFRPCRDDGTWSNDCQGTVLPAEELCDGLDNDCDGSTDEDGICPSPPETDETPPPDEGVEEIPLPIPAETPPEEPTLAPGTYLCRHGTRIALEVNTGVLYDMQDPCPPLPDSDVILPLHRQLSVLYAQYLLNDPASLAEIHRIVTENLAVNQNSGLSKSFSFETSLSGPENNQILSAQVFVTDYAASQGGGCNLVR